MVVRFAHYIVFQARLNCVRDRGFEREALAWKRIYHRFFFLINRFFSSKAE